MTKKQAVEHARERAKKRPGKTFVAFWDRELVPVAGYNTITMSGYQDPDSGISEQDYVCSVTWDEEEGQFEEDWE